MTFNGNPLNGTLIGTAPTPCRAGDGTAWSYIADVTGYVTGNGSYTVSGFPTRTEGASLIVIYNYAPDPLRNIVFYTGAYTIEGGLYYRYNWTMSNFRADNPASYANITFFYDGQDIPNGSDCGWEYLYYETYVDSAKQLIAGWDGAYWDDTTFDMTAYTAPGWTSVQVGYATDCDNHEQGGCTDCIGTQGAILSVNTPDPTEINETAAGAGLIRFGPGYVELTEKMNGDLMAYSPDGRLLSVLGSGELSAGKYYLSELGPGLYIVRLMGESSVIGKVVVR